jgi:cytochrome o ubiquinol oxidase subunit 2
VVALEWKWLFIYPDLGVAAVNELPVPVNTPVHFTITADAPMSAFWVPALGTQIYAMNGMSSQLNLIADHTGTFTGYNTNINGEGYAKMKFKVYAKSDKDFTSWIASARKSPNMMDEQALQKISQPGTMNETAYMLMDNNLYDKVVMKYMKGTMPDKDTTSTSTQHDMSNMEGM